MTVKVGYKASIKIGTTVITGMGQWSMDGIKSDEIEVSAFGDNWKSYEFGMKDGGNISFSGFYHPGDSGTDQLLAANVANTDITNMKLYLDATSYFEPCRTTGYLTPSLTSSQDTILSHCNITSFNIKQDKAGVAQIDFQAKVSGCFALV